VIREVIDSLFDLRHLRQQIILAYAADPRRSRIANSVIQAYQSPRVRAAVNQLLKVWMEEAERKYHD